MPEVNLQRVAAPPSPGGELVSKPAEKQNSRPVRGTIPISTPTDARIVIVPRIYFLFL